MKLKFGLCNPPEPIYLYVNKSDVDASLWYQFNVEKEEKTSVFERAVCGYLRELRLSGKEYKGKENLKLDIVVDCENEKYIIRSGMETVFSKSFLLAIALVKNIKMPLAIAVAPGKEKVVFATLYDATDWQKIKSTWSDNADWGGIIEAINRQLGVIKAVDVPANQTNQLKDYPPNPNPFLDTQIDRPMLMKKIESLMKRKEIGKETAITLMQKHYGKSTRAELSDAQLLELRDRISLFQTANATNNHG